MRNTLVDLVKIISTTLLVLTFALFGREITDSAFAQDQDMTYKNTQPTATDGQERHECSSDLVLQEPQTHGINEQSPCGPSGPGNWGKGGRTTAVEKRCECPRDIDWDLLKKEMPAWEYMTPSNLNLPDAPNIQCKWAVVKEKLMDDDGHNRIIIIVVVENCRKYADEKKPAP